MTLKEAMRIIKNVLLKIDKAIEVFALSAVAAMIIIVTVQVITRKAFNFVFFWSEEITLLLLVWFSFLGIAIGFRDKLHLAMDSFTNLLPRPVNIVLDKVIALCNLYFGYYLMRYGWEFTVLMYPNRMTATDWSSSVQYVIMPITGVLVAIYSILHLLGIDTDRHKEMEGVPE